MLATMEFISRIRSLPAALVASALLALTLTHAAASDISGLSRHARNAQNGVRESVRSGTFTAPDGQVAVTAIDRKWDEKSGTGTLNEAAVTPDGRVYSREANLTRNPDGTITAKGTFTDFDGRSYNYTETAKRSAAGQVEVGKMLDVDGKVSTYETTSTRTADQRLKRTMVITHADGTKETRVEILAPTRAVAGI